MSIFNNVIEGYAEEVLEVSGEYEREETKLGKAKKLGKSFLIGAKYGAFGAIVFNGIIFTAAAGLAKLSGNNMTIDFVRK